MSGKKKKGVRKQANSKNNRANQNIAMTQQALDDVEGWLSEMRVFTNRAILLAEKLDTEKLSDEDDVFWALVKYAENVEESIKQIDSINASILPVLEEIPIAPQEGNDISWKGFKAMRDVLTHQFKNIDPEILLAVVTEEFPVLNHLLEVLVVGKGTVERDKTFNVRFRAGLFRNLPSFEATKIVLAGKQHRLPPFRL